MPEGVTLNPRIGKTQNTSYIGRDPNNKSKDKNSEALSKPFPIPINSFQFLPNFSYDIIFLNLTFQGNYKQLILMAILIKHIFNTLFKR